MNLFYNYNLPQLFLCEKNSTKNIIILSYTTMGKDRKMSRKGVYELPFSLKG